MSMFRRMLMTALGNTFDFNLAYTLDNDSPLSADYFGWSVATQGNKCIIGVPHKNHNGTDTGKAYIFNTLDGSLIHTLINPNDYGTVDGDYFGYDVDIYEDRCIVGAYQEDYSGGTSSGRAYIFNTVTGVLVHTLDNPNGYNTADEDKFGFSVAMDGINCIVGAKSEDDVGGTTSGKAYIFNISTGILSYTLDNPNGYDTSLGDSFGFSVDIYGDNCIVGAVFEDDIDGTGSGKAYIFNTNTGVLSYTLDNPNTYSTSLGDNFGWSVAISGDNCIVGAYLEDDADGTSSGKAYIFNVTNGNLIYTLDNPNPAGSSSVEDHFGYAVDIYGNLCIVGAPGEYHIDNDDNLSGKAYIFNVSTGVLLDTIDNPNAYSTPYGDEFGNSVSIYKNTCVIGARYEDEDASSSGKVYIFD